MWTTKAALAHLGERQTEDNFSSDIWRHCVRSTEAAICESRITSIKNTIFFFRRVAAGWFNSTVGAPGGIASLLPMDIKNDYNASSHVDAAVVVINGKGNRIQCWKVL
jgi:hypothetical protein